MTPNSKSTGIPTVAIAAFVVLALAAVGMVLYAVFGLSDTTPPPALPPTPTEGGAVIQPSLAPARLPTVTSQPSPVPATAIPATQAAPPAALAPTVPATPTANLGATLNVALAANIRSGPGTNYPIIGGLQAGNAIPAIGRDTASQWYVISFATGAQGQGWISSAVASVNGDASSLPVVAAPPPPPPTAVPPTAVPTAAPAAPPPPSGRGIVGTLNLCDGRTTYSSNDRICVVEKIVNATGATIDYGILGVNAANVSGGSGWFQSSWTGTGHPGGLLSIGAGCTGPVGLCDGQWEDGFKLSAGTYQFTLSICYSTVGVCQSGGQWETLTAPITIIVQ